MKQKHTSKKFVIRLLLAILAFLMLAGVCVYTVFIRPNLHGDTVIYKESQVQKGNRGPGDHGKRKHCPAGEPYKL